MQVGSYLFLKWRNLVLQGHSLTSHKRGVVHTHFLPDCVVTWLREGELRGEREPSDVSPQLQGRVFVYILANWRATSPSATALPAAAVMETMARYS